MRTSSRCFLILSCKRDRVFLKVGLLLGDVVLRMSNVIHQVVHLALVDPGLVHLVDVFFSDKIVQHVRGIDDVHRVLRGLSLRFAKRCVRCVHHFVVGLRFQVLYWHWRPGCLHERLRFRKRSRVYRLLHFCWGRRRLRWNFLVLWDIISSNFFALRTFYPDVRVSEFFLFTLLCQLKPFCLLVLSFEEIKIVHDRLVSVFTAELVCDPNNEHDQEYNVESECNITNVQLGICGIVKEAVIPAIVHRFKITFHIYSLVSYTTCYRIDETWRSCCIIFRPPDEVCSLARFFVAQAQILVAHDSEG